MQPSPDPEVVLADCRPHVRLLAGPILVLLVICALLGYGWSAEGAAHRRVLLVATGVGVALAGWRTGLPWLRWRLLRYRVTSHRVSVTRGLLRRRTDELPLRAVVEVTLSSSLADRLVGAGDLTVRGAADGSVLTLRSLPRARRVRAALSDRMQAAGAAPWLPRNEWA